MNFPIALQLYSVRNAAEKDIEAVLKEIKSYGYDGVELAGLYGKTPKEMADLLNRFGLKPISAHVPYAEMCADIEKVIKDYKTIGCEYIAIPWLAEADRINGENAKEAVENISLFAKLCKENGITLCYHNHDFEFVKIGNEYAFDMLYSEIPELFVQQDSCWVAVAGESPVAYLEKYKNRTPVLHVKDYCGNKKEGSFEYRPVGYGVQDFKSIVSAAEKNGVKWLVIEQDEPSMDKTELECAKLSIDYLKTI